MYEKEKEIARAILKRPANVAYSGNLDLWSTWGLYTIEHRDSGLLDQSNSAEIQKRFKALDPTGEQHSIERFSCWLVGWRDHLAVKVVDDPAELEKDLPAFTLAFLLLCDIIAELDNYPILNEGDYTDRELEALQANMWQACLYWRDPYGDRDAPDLSEQQVYEVESWLSTNDPSSIDNIDDTGGWPNDVSLARAFEALGFIEPLEE